MTFRPMPFLTLCTLAGLAVLVWLGHWQWVRYDEKTTAPDTIPVAGLVTLSGEIQDYPVQFVYTTFRGEALWRSFVTVEGCFKAPETDTVCEQLMFVDVALLSAIDPGEVGFIPDDLALERNRYVPVENGERSFLSPSDSPDKGIWYVLSADRLAQALDIDPASVPLILEPEIIEIIRKAPDGTERRQQIDNPFANPARLDDLPPARHLGYALTWFGLAGTLIAVYLAFHITTGRLKTGRKKSRP